MIRIDLNDSKISAVHQRTVIARRSDVAVLHVLLFSVCVCSLIGKV